MNYQKGKFDHVVGGPVYRKEWQRIFKPEEAMCVQCRQSLKLEEMTQDEAGEPVCFACARPGASE